MISDALHQHLSLDLPPLLTAVFSALSCALLGNFLVLRKLSLMGDAISHAVLPGIVAAFLLTGDRGSLTVFAGAAIAGVLTTVCVEFVREHGRIESGAAMGVVFSVFFAIGVLLIEQAAARQVDLDAECLLHGQLELIFWSPPHSWSELLSFETLTKLPTEVKNSFFVLLFAVIFVSALFKELTLAAFDPALATSLGFSSRVLHYLLMVFVAGAVVASFEAVGSILVIAMIICPAAIARMLTDSIRRQVALSLFFSFTAAAGGYVLGAFGPSWLGYSWSLNSAGMMVVVLGALLTGAVLFSPRYGIVARAGRRLLISIQIAREDVLGLLYRFLENGRAAVGLDEIRAALSGLWGDALLRFAIFSAKRAALIETAGGSLQLTGKGKEAARGIVRSHRLWETFLVERFGLRIDHVHDTAMKLEHFAPSDISAELKDSSRELDPHGREIPSE